MWCRDDHFLNDINNNSTVLDFTHHLHSTQNSKWITLLDLTTILDTKFHNHTSHWCSNLAAVSRIGLGSAGVLNSSFDIIDCDLTDLTCITSSVSDRVLTGMQSYHSSHRILLSGQWNRTTDQQREASRLKPCPSQVRHGIPRQSQAETRSIWSGAH
jgi:hypothetical protein